MKNDISWATSKEPEKNKIQTEGKQLAGKGDSPRHNLRKYDKGYNGIRWKNNK